MHLRALLLVVSLDNANAFNSLLFRCIREALQYHRVPEYLGLLEVGYLMERIIMYEEVEMKRIPDLSFLNRRLAHCVWS